MSVELRLNEDGVEQLRRQAALRLLKAAITLASKHQRNLSKANPPPDFRRPSRPGEFPRARTYNGRDSVDYTPKSVEEVLQGWPEMSVRVGHRENGWYMVFLEEYMQRKGLKDTLMSVQSQLSSIVASGGP